VPMWRPGQREVLVETVRIDEVADTRQRLQRGPAVEPTVASDR